MPSERAKRRIFMFSPMARTFSCMSLGTVLAGPSCSHQSLDISGVLLGMTTLATSLTKSTNLSFLATKSVSAVDLDNNADPAVRQ